MAVGMHTKWEFRLSPTVIHAEDAHALAGRLMDELVARADRGELHDPATASEFDRRVIVVEMLVHGTDQTAAAHNTNQTMMGVLDAANAVELVSPIFTEVTRVTA